MSFSNGAIIANIRATIDAQFGPINSNLRPGEISYLDTYRQKLAIIVAEAGIYTRDHATVTVHGVQLGGADANGELT